MLTNIVGRRKEVRLRTTVSNRFSIYKKEMNSRFEISTDGSRGAVVVFGKDASKDNAIKFDNGLSNEKLGKKIMELPFPNDKERRIDLGLSFVESELFQDGKGERRKILILITDGAQVPTNPMDASGKLIESGVVIYVLAVGDKIDRAQLNKIAHVSDRVYPTENFGKLRDKDFADDVTSMICKEEETIA